MASAPDVPDPEAQSADSTVLAEYESAVAGYTAAGADETVQRVVTALARVTKRLDGFYRSQLADLNLQRGDWGVLQALAIQSPDGCSTPSRLADAVGVSPSTMTHRLDLLAERGLIERAVDPDNRTRNKVKVTRAGRELFQRAILDADLVESEVLASLTPSDQRRLADLLERVLAGFPSPGHSR